MDIDNTIKSLRSMSQFGRTKIDNIEEHLIELKNKFYTENSLNEDDNSVIDIERKSVSNNDIIEEYSFNSFNKNSIFTHIKEEPKNESVLKQENIGQNELLINENFIKKISLIQEAAKDKFSPFQIFNKKNISLTIVISCLLSIAATISTGNIYNLPLALLKISKEREIENSISNPHLNNSTNNASDSQLHHIIHHPSLENDYPLYFFIANIVTLLGLVLGIFLLKNLGRKLTILYMFIPCCLMGIFACIFREMILASTAVVNFFVVIPLLSVKLLIVESFDSKLRDACYSFAFFSKTIADSLVPFIVSGLINKGLLVPMYYLTAISGLAVFISMLIEEKPKEKQFIS
jgi:hypothetical protein